MTLPVLHHAFMLLRVLLKPSPLMNWLLQLTWGLELVRSVRLDEVSRFTSDLVRS
jgi:hypothetical protein